MKSDGFENAFSNSLKAAKDKLVEKGTSYEKLNDFIQNDLYKIGKDYYWYTYDKFSNRTFKHNTLVNPSDTSNYKLRTS